MIRPLAPADDLAALIADWEREGHAGRFGLSVNAQELEKHIRALPHCLIMERDEKAVGFMGLNTFLSPLGGGEKIANEHLWYVMPAYRGNVRAFMTAAASWARKQGCSHLMMNASHMASDRCERVSEFYAVMGFRPFENVFLMEV